MRKKSKSNKIVKNKTIEHVLLKHSSVLKKYTVVKIGLFGSYTKGKQRKNSDLDFIVEFANPTFDNFMGLLSSLEYIFRKKIDLITKGNISKYILPYVEKDIIWYEI